MPPGTERLFEGAVAEPIDVAQLHPAGAQSLARADHHPARLCLEPDHIEWMASGNTETAPLSDGEMDDAVMAAKHAAVQINDVARFSGAGPQPFDDFGVAAGRHEADILTIVLVGD